MVGWLPKCRGRTWNACWQSVKRHLAWQTTYWPRSGSSVRFAIAHHWRSDDPTLGIKRLRLGTIHTWTDEEIEAYIKVWPIGTLERTAFALLLYTGQRVSDVVRMFWSDLKAGWINVVQQKTEEKS